MLGQHYFGIYEKAFPSDMSWEERFSAAKKLGFDYIELSIDESDERLSRLDWTPKETEELRHLAAEYELPFRSMCLSAHRRFPFGSEDEQIQTRAREIMEKAIRLSERLGIRVIQLAGYDVYYEKSSSASVRRFRAAMLWAAQLAEQAQMMLGMEIMDTCFLNSISKHMSYESMIHSPWYRVYPDLGNLSAWPENDVEVELAQGISSIVGVHLKDTLAVTDDFPGQFKGVPFGSGCVDFPARFAQLERLGYRGPYMMEMWHSGKKRDSAEIAAAKKWMEEQFRLGVSSLTDSCQRGCVCLKN